MLEQLKRPFKRHYEKYRSKLDGFVGPVKESASKLFAMLPKMEAFAGSEDLGEEHGEAVPPDGLKAEFRSLQRFRHEAQGLAVGLNSAKACVRHPLPVQ